jgi:hypothetical protein
MQIGSHVANLRNFRQLSFERGPKTRVKVTFSVAQTCGLRKSVQGDVVGKGTAYPHQCASLMRIAWVA